MMMRFHRKSAKKLPSRLPARIDHRHCLETLESRLLLADPAISGPASAVEGEAYVLTLATNDVTDIHSWTINWGDGNTQLVEGTPPSVQHTYDDGPGRYVITAVAHSATVNYNAGSIGLPTGASFETNFGTYGSGLALTQLDSTGTSPTVYESVLYPDGRVLQVGFWNGSGGHLQLTRHLTNGALDPSFDGDGKVYGLLNGTKVTFASGVTLQPDGKILVSASLGGTFADFTVIRFNDDGSLDNTFGDGGIVTYDYAGEADAAEDIIYDPNTGRILVGGSVRDSAGFYGFGILALDEVGEIDTGFGEEGWARYQAPASLYTTGKALALDNFGQVLIAGRAEYSTSRLAVARFTFDGQLDNTFGSAGGTLIQYGFDNDIVNDMVVLTDGRIALAGSATVHTSIPNGTAIHSNGVVALLTDTGALDPTFAVRAVDFTRSNDFLNGIAVDPQGRLVVAGSTFTSSAGTQTNMLVARFNLDGTLDGSFGDAGKFIIDFPQANPPHVRVDQAEDVLIDAHGNITLVGDSYSQEVNFAHIAFARLYLGQNALFVQNAPPVVGLAGPAEHLVNTPYTLQFATLEDGDDAPTRWRISWGDGTTEFLPGSAVSAQHIYTSTLDYTITVTAYDEDGSYQATKLLKVTPPPPFIDEDGVLSILGRQANDAFNFSVAGGNLILIFNNTIYDFPVDDIGFIQFDTGGGADQIIVGPGVPGGNFTLAPSQSGIAQITLKSGLAPAVPFNIIAHAAPNIVVEPNLGAPVSISGPGNPKLHIHATPGNDTIALELNATTSLGNSITYTDTTSFLIFGGDGNDTITTNLPTPTLLNRFLTVNAGAGDDLIQLFTGTLSGQNGNAIDAGDGDDRLEIHDGMRGNFVYGGDAGIDTLIFEGTGGNDQFNMSTLGINLFGNLTRTVSLRAAGPGRTATAEVIEVHGLGGNDTMNAPAAMPNGVHFIGGPGEDVFAGGSTSSFIINGDRVQSTFGWTAAVDAERADLSVPAGSISITVNSTPAMDVRFASALPASLNVYGGTFTARNGALSMPTSLTVNVSATLVLEETVHLDNLSIGSGGKTRLIPGGDKTLFVSGIQINSGGLLDLADNELVAEVPEAARQSLLQHLTGKIRLARGREGNWEWTEGLTSSNARDDASGLTGLALVPTATGFRVKYTWAADADGDDRITADDYAIVDRGFLRRATFFHEGNINFFDAVDLDDYALIDLTFLAESSIS